MTQVRMLHLTLVAWTLVAALCSCLPAMAATYYVAPNGSPQGDGSPEHPWDLPTANQNLQPGDVAVMRGGSYPTGIAPARSGIAGSPITYQAAVGETPLIYAKKGVPIGIDLRLRSYITIDGISANKCGYWILGEQSSHITIQNCHFTNSSNWESSRFRRMGDYLHISNSHFENGTDNVTVEGGNYHLIEGNRFDTASHTCLVFMGVQHSVIRANYFRNPIQKCQEVFSTRQAQWPDPQRKSEYLVIEDNEYALSTGKKIDIAAIQYSGNNSILRRNVFHDCGYAWDCTTYTDDAVEAWYNQHNRFYHNTVYYNGYRDTGIAVKFDGDPTLPDFGDQVLVNNIVYLNQCNRSGFSQSLQILFDGGMDPADAALSFNDIMYTQPAQKVFGQKSPWGEWTLAEYQTAYPLGAWNNIEADPLFVNPGTGDFHLQPTSPCIDAGGPLSYTVSAGSGTVIPVVDALFFSDGKGVVAPDVIRVNGVQRTITAVDYANNWIEVSESLTWAADAPIDLDYVGSAPDIGAFEYGQ